MIWKISKGQTQRFGVIGTDFSLISLFLVSWISSLFHFPSFFSSSRTNVRVKSTPAALPNATGVVIDFDRKICCYLSTMKSIACATSEFLFSFFFSMEVEFWSRARASFMPTCNITFTIPGGYVGERACSIRVNWTRLTQTDKVNVNSSGIYVSEYRKVSQDYREQFQIHIFVNVTSVVISLWFIGKIENCLNFGIWNII